MVHLKQLWFDIFMSSFCLVCTKHVFSDSNSEVGTEAQESQQLVTPAITNVSAASTNFVLASKKQKCVLSYRNELSQYV